MIKMIRNLWKKKASPLVKHWGRPGDFQAGVSRATLVIHLVIMMIIWQSKWLLIIIWMLEAEFHNFGILGIPSTVVYNFKWWIITWTEATLVGLRLVKQRVSPQVWPLSGYQCSVWVLTNLMGILRCSCLLKVFISYLFYLYMSGICVTAKDAENV